MSTTLVQICDVVGKTMDHLKPFTRKNTIRLRTNLYSISASRTYVSFHHVTNTIILNNARVMFNDNRVVAKMVSRKKEHNPALAFQTLVL